MARDLEGILEQKSPGTRTKIVPVFPPDLPGTKSLSPAGPLTICGGTLSGYPSYSYVQESGSLCSKESISVNQESKTTAELAAATAKPGRFNGFIVDGSFYPSCPVVDLVFRKSLHN